MPDQDLTQSLQEQVQAAIAQATPLNIIGGNSKAFYGREAVGEPLYLSGHRGIVHYAPTELVVTARAGTPVQELEQTLAEAGQMLPFEPPQFGDGDTVGGTVACNLSGPRRPYAGSVRDHVLGVKIINGKGELLHFGGEVMKNVAGYDLSRLMAGAMGSLGVLLEVSLKVVPRPQRELTLYRDCTGESAIATMNEWASRPYPVSAAAFDGHRLCLRFSGSDSAVAAAQAKFGGTELRDGEAYWSRLNTHQHAFFEGGAPLWRLSLPPATPHLDIQGKQLLDWGGAQRWLRSDLEAEQVHALARDHGGHAVLFRGGDRKQPFQALEPVLERLHRNLKQSLDPHGIFNTGRLYAGL